VNSVRKQKTGLKLRTSATKNFSWRAESGPPC